MKDLTVPFIHLNGDSPETLVRELRSAFSAVQKAIEAVKETAPNARNFYVTEGSFEKARDEHIRRISSLAEVSDELIALALGILEQKPK